MRYKPVPEPPDSLAGLETVHAALPRVPRPEGDCCARLADRVPWIEDREAGREWLLFLRALGLARRTTDGSYVRDGGTDDRTGPSAGRDGPELDRERLADRFAERVVAADAVLDALGDEPRDVDAVLDALASTIPAWERERSADWRRTWRRGVERRLCWWALFGEVRATGGEYAVRNEGSPGPTV